MPSLDYSRNQKVYARARVCANTQYHHLPEQKPRYREAFFGAAEREETKRREEKAGIPFHRFLAPLSRGPADMMMMGSEKKKKVCLWKGKGVLSERLHAFPGSVTSRFFFFCY